MSAQIPNVPLKSKEEKELDFKKMKVAQVKPLESHPLIGQLARDPSDEDQLVNAADMLVELHAEVNDTTNNPLALPETEPVLTADNIMGLLYHRIARLDEEINEGLSNTMHDKGFQTLEATWRGLHYLVSNTETGEMLKLRILDATKDEIRNDLAKAVEFDQSVQFKKIYEEEYGTFGGAPYSMLVADYFFEGTQPDLEFLEKMSGVAAAAHAPFIAAADPGLFDLNSFAELNMPRDLTKIFGSTLFAKWKSFRESEDSRYVALCLPRFLLRSPYGKDDYKQIDKTTGEYVKDNRTKEPVSEALVGRAPAAEIDFQEQMPLNGGQNHDFDNKFLWGNAAYLMTERITNAFSHYKWTAAIRGVEGGGLVEGLPAINFQTNEGDLAFKCPVEVSITDRREKELSDLGFISLVHRKNTDQAAFFGGQTTQKPKVYMDPKATANARLSCSLPYILAASRFAHYIKVIMRDKVGSFMSRDNVEKFLNSWISNYVLLNDNASQASKASYPLREARVDVTDIPGKPGCYNATVYLRPHFQLEELTASIRLVAELPPPAAA
ncbi:MAG TPA: type VI secretion system contractile sheath large subunit [Pyrinomonadaceae bacterium]|nr:type VI secretion system contractile sheath large subunit [Pyrinomonadaceae bacterium]